MSEKITLKIDTWQLKLQERTRNRMKLQIKFSKEEALAVKNFMKMVKPPEISEDDFMRGVFKLGIETMEMKLMDAVKDHMEENNIDASAMGLSEVNADVQAS
tara:strand:- start:385 stop:690 length:306 start_codon:yes stop_codon:yes gene_type:complete